MPVITIKPDPKYVEAVRAFEALDKDRAIKELEKLQKVMEVLEEQDEFEYYKDDVNGVFPPSTMCSYLVQEICCLMEYDEKED